MYRVAQLHAVSALYFELMNQEFMYVICDRSPIILRQWEIHVNQTDENKSSIHIH